MQRRRGQVQVRAPPPLSELQILTSSLPAVTLRRLQLGDSGDGSVSKEDLNLDPQTHAKLGAVARACNPRSEEVETGRGPWSSLSRQPSCVHELQLQ